MQYVVSKFVDVIKNNSENELLFFNRNTLKLLKGDNEDLEYLLDYKKPKNISSTNETVINFIKNKFIVPMETNEDDDLKQNRILRIEEARSNNNKVGYLRISLTEKCNLRCSYCFINSIYAEKEKKDMYISDFKQYLNWFILENKNDSPIIQYFGGEPLLRVDLIKEGHKLLEESKINGTIKNFQEEIVTNGTLITPELANFLYKSNMGVCFSIDGWKALNDKNRVYPNGKGSFTDIKNGIDNFKSVGGVFKAIITPTNDNIYMFKDIVKYLVEEMECKEISVNTPQPTTSGWEIDGSKLALAIIDAWSYCDTKKIPFNGPGTNVVFLINKCIPQSFSCMNLTYGQNINSYGVYINSGNAVSNCVVECNSQCIKDFDKFSVDKDFIDWHFISNIKDQCLNCIAVNICGGPCKIENLICKSGINVEKCKFYKSIIPWIIKQ